MLNSIHLAGCRPVPMAAYLKALGVLRLVAEQLDPEAAGAWQGEEFVLTTCLDRTALVEFFLHDYRPTALLSPWNGGSGFYRPGNTTAWNTLTAIKAARADRLQPLARTAVAIDGQLAALGLERQPDGGKEKHQLLLQLRATLDDAYVGWLDATVMLGLDDPRYPPLLGSGGNDGRLDFTSNFHQRLRELMDLDTGQPLAWAELHLNHALFGSATPGLGNRSMGQFDPGASGKATNSGPGFGNHGVVNAWDYVLMLEGALLFAATITRRLEAEGAAQLSYPFTVPITGVGAGGMAPTDAGKNRSYEIWLPLWRQPAGLTELRSLLGEGRVNLHGKRVGTGLDFIRAIARLGVDRGLQAFQRYAFLERFGRAYLAAPLNRIAVARRPRADLIDQLDRRSWLDRLRRAAGRNQAPGRLVERTHRLENALFELSRSEQVSAVQEALVQLGSLHDWLATAGSRIREELLPLAPLSPGWALAADDGSHEFRLAAALASLDGGMPLVFQLFPIHPENRGQWLSSSHWYGWQGAGLADNLFRVMNRRLLEERQRGLASAELLQGRCPVDDAALAALLAGNINERRLVELLKGLSLVRLPNFLPRRQQDGTALLPAALALFKPLFVNEDRLRDIGVLAAEQRLPLPPALPRLLHSGQLQRALTLAQQRRRGSRLTAAPWQLSPGQLSGPRLLSALLVPVDEQLLHKLEASIQGGEMAQAAAGDHLDHSDHMEAFQ